MSTEKTITLELTHDQALHIWHVLCMTSTGTKEDHYKDSKPQINYDKVLHDLDSETFSCVDAVLGPLQKESAQFSFESPSAPTSIGCQNLTYSPSGVTLSNGETVSIETLKAMIARCEDV